MQYYLWYGLKSETPLLSTLVRILLSRHPDRGVTQGGGEGRERERNTWEESSDHTWSWQYPNKRKKITKVSLAMATLYDSQAWGSFDWPEGNQWKPVAARPSQTPAVRRRETCRLHNVKHHNILMTFCSKQSVTPTHSRVLTNECVIHVESNILDPVHAHAPVHKDPEITKIQWNI